MNLDNSCSTIGVSAPSTENEFMAALRSFVFSEQPSQEAIQKLLNYDPITGKFSWKSRPAEAFANPSNCKRWNTQHAGKEISCVVFQRVGAKRKREVVLSVRFNGVKKYLSAHRLAWVLMCGQIPSGKIIDHVNGDPTDNRIENLRLATYQQNAHNRRPDFNGIGFKGVRYSNGKKDRFISFIQGAAGPKYLGVFSSAEAAARAYDKEAIIRHGKFARLNFPQG